MKRKMFSRSKKVSVVLAMLFAVLFFTYLTQAVIPGGKVRLNGQSTGDPRDKLDIEFAEGEVLVKFKNGVGIIKANALALSLSAEVKKHYRTISRTNGCVYVHLKSETLTTLEMLRELKGHPDVETAELNHRLQVDATIPNDTRFDELWGLHNTGQTGGAPDVDIDAPEAWDNFTGSTGVIAAVLDTGIDYNHTDLAANMWTNPGEIADNGIDDDGNGYIDDVHGINAITGSGNPMDDQGHGTHCAGTIGGVGNNGMGVAGVNWSVQLLAAKFLDAGGYGYTGDAIACLDYILDMKTTYGQNIAVINASWGGGSYSQTLKDAIDAVGTAGIVFCAAAGNYGDDNDIYPHYPSSYDCSNIIAVTAVDEYGFHHYSYGAASVDLAAPGVSILSTVPCSYSPQPGDIFYDDMESGDGSWTHGGTLDSWGITDADSGGLENYWWDMSYGNFWSDSPGVGYVHNIDNWLATSASIDLSSYVGQDIFMGFEGGFQFDYFMTNDTAAVEVSDDGGGNWYTLADLTTLYQYYGYYYISQVYEIPDAYKSTNFKFRFHITSDDTDYNYYGYKNKGWIIDNVGVGGVSCGYDYKSGTSMATPHVSGAVAFISACYPTFNSDQVIARILDNIVPLASLDGKCATGGLLNLDLALGSLTLTCPNGSESWPLGSLREITWNATTLSDDVKITLWKDSVLVGIIAPNVDPALGSYTWEVGTYIGGTAPAGTGYTIKIKERNSTLMDISDAPFEITDLPPSLTVLSPNGGEVWARGDTKQITWNKTGFLGDLKITLWQGDIRVGTIVTATDSSTGSYSWMVGQLTTGTAPIGDYTIKIKERETDVADCGDAPFSIIDPTITVISPNGGENWMLGCPQQIEWEAVGIYGDVKISLFQNGNRVGTIAANIAPDSSPYPWYVGQLLDGIAAPGGSYTITVREMGTTVVDTSDAPFTISPAPTRSWTFMVYLDADNNLEEAGIDDFLEMASVGSDGNINIVAQFDRVNGYDSSYGDWTSTKRYLITNGMTPTAANAIMDLGEANMGDPATLADFVNWSKTLYPASNYALVIWNHGDGWRNSRQRHLRDIKEGKRDPLIFKGVCQDETDGDYLYMAEVKNALAGSGGAQLIGFDACLMGMMEVAYEIRNHGLVMVGSEETEPWDGWPYYTILADLIGNPSWTPAQLGSAIVDRYYASYGEGFTQAAIDLSQVGALAGTVSTLAQTMVDYWDSDKGAVRSAAREVKTGINNTVINEKHGDFWPNAHGLAIYFPEYSYSFDSDYNGTTIDFPNDTQWEEFLQEFYTSMGGSWISERRTVSQEFEAYYFAHIDLCHFCELLDTVPGNYYEETQITNAFTGGGTAQGLHALDAYMVYTLPFDFPYFGETIPSGTDIFISTKAYIDFDPSSNHTDWTNSKSELAANKRIAALWTDLRTNGSAQAGEDIYITENTDNVIIRWAAETYYFEEPVNVEIVLYQDGRIQFNYNGGNVLSYFTPTIGISKGDSANYYLSVYDGLGTLTDVDSDLYTLLAPSLMVTSPNGGENWALGSLQEIDWSYSGISGLIKISLWQGSTNLGVIAADVDISSGSYQWEVGKLKGGTIVPAASGYSIKIMEKDTTISDFSDASFEITGLGPSLTVLSPNGGENWTIGSTRDITWNKTGFLGDLKISLWKDGVLVGNISSAVDASDGSYSWTVGDYIGGIAAPGTGYTIKIREKGTTVVDESDAAFTLL